uniref:Osteoclast stimulatory transmembrane protein n=1 Tax=Gopherus evgoodei TaxID=1825980 RepID=A0A8C4W7I2_9SAUR
IILFRNLLKFLILLGNLFPKIQEVMLDAWSAYSKPVPSSCSELLTLFLQCCCIAVLTGGLLYNWLFSSLEYPFHLSSAIAISFSLLLLLILFLVHPVRCMFTIIIPTLGTKQGRRLLLSTCFMIVAVNTIPNIMDNIKTIVQVIKCICKNYSESLLTSTILLGKASMQFDNFLIQKINDDISAVELLVKQALLVANRVAAGFFLFYLLFESAWYLKSYLTNLRFDNIYITKKLKVWAVDKKAAHLLTSLPKKLIRSTGLKLSREEMMLCLVRMMLPSLVLMVTAVIIATDYITFHLADTAMNEVAQFPTVPITLNIKYDVSSRIPRSHWSSNDVRMKTFSFKAYVLVGVALKGLFGDSGVGRGGGVKKSKRINHVASVIQGRSISCPHASKGESGKHFAPLYSPLDK